MLLTKTGILRRGANFGEKNVFIIQSLLIIKLTSSTKPNSSFGCECGREQIYRKHHISGGR